MATQHSPVGTKNMTDRVKRIRCIAAGLIVLQPEVPGHGAAEPIGYQARRAAIALAASKVCVRRRTRRAFRLWNRSGSSASR